MKIRKSVLGVALICLVMMLIIPSTVQAVENKKAEENDSEYPYIEGCSVDLKFNAKINVVGNQKPDKGDELKIGVYTFGKPMPNDSEFDPFNGSLSKSRIIEHDGQYSLGVIDFNYSNTPLKNGESKTYNYEIDFWAAYHPDPCYVFRLDGLYESEKNEVHTMTVTITNVEGKYKAKTTCNGKEIDSLPLNINYICSIFNLNNKLNNLKIRDTSGRIGNVYNYVTKLSAAEGYRLPKKLNIYYASDKDKKVEYQYEANTGELFIPSSSITGDIVIEGEGEKIVVPTYNIKRQLTGLTSTCNNTEQRVTNSVCEKLIPEEGYGLPDSVIVKIGGKVVHSPDCYYSNKDGLVYVENYIINGDVEIIAQGKNNKYEVENTGAYTEVSQSPESAFFAIDYIETIKAEEGYTLPNKIHVSVKGKKLTDDQYIYNKDTGKIIIPGKYVTGPIKIKADSNLKNPQVIYMYSSEKPSSGVTSGRSSSEVSQTISDRPSSRTLERVSGKTSSGRLVKTSDEGSFAVAGIAFLAALTGVFAGRKKTN